MFGGNHQATIGISTTKLDIPANLTCYYYSCYSLTPTRQNSHQQDDLLNLEPNWLTYMEKWHVPLGDMYLRHVS